METKFRLLKVQNNNFFKNFYAHLALSLVNKLPHAPNKFHLGSVLAYYKRFLNTEKQKFTFSLTSEDEILKLLTDTNPEKEAGMDNLSGRFLKDGAAVLDLPISKLCNLSMKRSKFPLDYKIAKLKSLYKKSSKTDPKNYRPVSLLPLVSKVIEKVIHNQIEIRQNRFLNKPLRRLLCNAMIQPFFEYACPAWYPSLRKDLQKRLQVSQNGCVRFCLQLDKKTRIGVAEFKEINKYK